MPHNSKFKKNDMRRQKSNPFAAKKNKVNTIRWISALERLGKVKKILGRKVTLQIIVVNTNVIVSDGRILIL